MGTKSKGTIRQKGVWAAPAALGQVEIVRGMGGVIPPVIAGFSLATIATLVTADDQPRLVDWASAGLAATAMLFVYTMQAAITALRYWSTPDDRLMWKPEAINESGDFEDLRWHHALDQALFKTYTNRARHSYNLGMVAFVSSIVLLVIPSGPPGEWELSQWVLVGVASAGALGEMVLILSGYELRPRRLRTRRRVLWPEPVDIATDMAPLPEVASEIRIWGSGGHDLPSVSRPTKTEGSSAEKLEAPKAASEAENAEGMSAERSTTTAP